MSGLARLMRAASSTSTKESKMRDVRELCVLFVGYLLMAAMGVVVLVAAVSA